MPLHDYKCRNCGKVYEILQKADEPAPNCKKCDGELEKLISTFAVGGSDVHIPMPFGWTFVGQKVGECPHATYYQGYPHRTSSLN